MTLTWGIRKGVMWPILSILVLFIFTPQQAEAKKFRNSYVSFELPPKWECYLEGTAWICRYSIKADCKGPKAKTKTCRQQRQKTKEAIIILTAKEVGPKDSFKNYAKQLKTPRTVVNRKKKRTSSKIIHVKKVTVGNHPWVDGMHMGSEVPHYYTRYLATIKGNIAVLVTFSAHKLFYTKYSHSFFAAIKSLRVVASKIDTVKPNETSKARSGELGVDIGAHLGDALLGADEEFEDDSMEESDLMWKVLMLGALLLAVLGIFIWIKGRR